VALPWRRRRATGDTSADEDSRRRAA